MTGRAAWLSRRAVQVGRASMDAPGREREVAFVPPGSTQRRTVSSCARAHRRPSPRSFTSFVRADCRDLWQ
eukprot:3711056-Prymnesium_polylepis.2